MAYIVRADLEKYMSAAEIDQIIDGDSTIIDTTISDAEENVKEMLVQRYDVATEYAKTGTDRNPSLVQNVVKIALYYLSMRLNTQFMTESRRMAFEDSQKWLHEIARGYRTLDLTEADAENKQGYPVTYGGVTKTDNNI